MLGSTTCVAPLCQRAICAAISIAGLSRRSSMYTLPKKLDGLCTLATLDDALASADVLVMLVDHNEFKAVSGSFGVDDIGLGNAIAANGFKLVVIDQHHQHIGARLACFGLAFKPNIDDLRESPAMEIAAQIARWHSGATQI
jgi:UDP-N-acetyl-D-mannosaminuronate dehydrogenase